MDERLVAVEQAVSSGQQVAFQPALAQVLGQHLHHPPVRGEVIVAGHRGRVPGAVGRLEHRREPVGRGLVRAHQPEPVGVRGDDVAQERAQHPGGLAGLGRGAVNRHRVVAEVGHHQVAQQQPAVGMRVGAHPPVPRGASACKLRDQPSALVEQLVGPVAAQPLLEQLAVLGVAAGLGQRDLVGAEGALDRDAVDLLRPGPALRGAQHDHRPRRAGRRPVRRRRGRSAGWPRCRPAPRRGWPRAADGPLPARRRRRSAGRSRSRASARRARHRGCGPAPKFIKVNRNLIFLFFTRIVKVIMIISKSNKNISRNGLINSYIFKTNLPPLLLIKRNIV